MAEPRYCLDCGRKLSRTAKWSGTKRCSPCYGKTLKLPDLHCIDCGKKLGKTARFFSAKRCVSCANREVAGRIWTEERRRSFGASRKGKIVGPRNGKWKGGITKGRKLVQNSDAYKAWRLSVLKADNYTCCRCGVRGGVLHAHHILPYAQYPAVRTERSNGATLCVPCHKQLHFELRREA